MIQDLDQSIINLLTVELQGKFEGLSFSLHPPNRDSLDSAGFSPPLIDIFLYDVRENMDVRHSMLRPVGDHDLIPIECNYIITAFFGVDNFTNPTNADTMQEQEALSAALAAMHKYSSLPNQIGGEQILHESLYEADPAPVCSVSQRNAEMNISEFWSAMDDTPRAHFNYDVTFLAPVFPKPTGVIITTSDLRKLQQMEANQ